VPSCFGVDQTDTLLSTYPIFLILSSISIVAIRSAKDMSVEDGTITTNVRLPPDVWQLLFDELGSRNDFSSLYNCAVASKHLAGSGALANLYR
jgi:hypothetical protein